MTVPPCETRFSMHDKKKRAAKGLYQRPSVSPPLSSSASEDDGSLDSHASMRSCTVELAIPIDVDAKKTHDSKAGYSEFDVASYMAKREMTPFQERMNAVTMIPSVMYCLFFLLSGTWLSDHYIEQTGVAMYEKGYIAVEPSEFVRYILKDEHGCVSSPLGMLYGLPPLPIIAVAAGIILHAPFSFIYHWRYAHRLPPGYARTDHWSRRMDQAMIHVASALFSFGTSGSWSYFGVNALFNFDCFARQFESKVQPKRNQKRIMISMILYCLPILQRGNLVLVCEIGAICTLSSWLFSAYPIGGWSHSAFHLVIALLPPLLMRDAIDLPASRAQLDIAAQCAAMKATI